MLQSELRLGNNLERVSTSLGSYLNWNFKGWWRISSFRDFPARQLEEDDRRSLRFLSGTSPSTKLSPNGRNHPRITLEPPISRFDNRSCQFNDLPFLLCEASSSKLTTVGWLALSRVDLMMTSVFQAFQRYQAGLRALLVEEALKDLAAPFARSCLESEGRRRLCCPLVHVAASCWLLRGFSFYFYFFLL